MALDKNVEAFIIYMICFNLSLILIYQVKKVKITLLLTKKIKIKVKYSDFLNIFLEKNVLVLSKLNKSN